MNDKKQAWNKFIVTGKINDYLDYCSGEQYIAVEGHVNYDDKDRWDNSEPEVLSGFGKIHDDPNTRTGFN